jgi:hypothetical protein
MVKIGIIDSGINIDTLVSDNIINGYSFVNDLFHDSLGHGTACAYLIQQVYPDANLYNIKVFDKKLVTTPRIILNAMDWCLQNEIDIIHISISINDATYFYEFNKICKKIKEKNIVVVSAADNYGRFSLPAYIDGVFGVGAANFNNLADFYFLEDESIQFYAKGSQLLIPEINGELYIGSGTSFAASVITGLIAKLIDELSIERIEVLIKEMKLRSKDFNIQNVIKFQPSFDFDLNTKPIKMKDCNLSIDFENESKITIYGNHLTTSLFKKHLISINPSIFNIISHPIDETTVEINLEEERSDTLLIADVDYSNVPLGRFKSIVLFDPEGLYTNSQNDNSSEILTPSLFYDEIISNVQKIPPKAILRNCKPILALINISQNRYFFDFELEVRNMLIEKDFNIASIGSGIFSEFFGCELSLPPFYIMENLPLKSQIAIPKIAVDHVNEKYDCDLILFGINLNSFAWLDNSSLFDTSYLLDYITINSVQPDIVAFVINDFDTVDHIINAIKLRLSAARTDNIVVLRNAFNDCNFDFSNEEFSKVVKNSIKYYNDNFEFIKSTIMSTFNFPVFNLNISEELHQFIKHIKI